MNGILDDASTSTTDVEKIKYQADVNVFLSQSQVPGTFSKYPTITIEEVKAFLEEEATTKDVNSSKPSKRNSKVMKFKFLEGKDSESGTPELITPTEELSNKKNSKTKSPELITATEEPCNKSESGTPELITPTEELSNKKNSKTKSPELITATEEPCNKSESGTPELIAPTEELSNKKNSKTKSPELITATEEPCNKSESGTPELIAPTEESSNKKNPKAKSPELITATEEPCNAQDGTEDNSIHYKANINLSLCESIVPTNFSNYPRITVSSKTKDKKTGRKKQNLKTSVNSAKIPVQDLTTTISRMSSRQLTNLLRQFSPEKLQSIQNSISKIQDAQKREIIAAKKAQIEKLRKEIEDL